MTHAPPPSIQSLSFPPFDAFGNLDPGELAGGAPKYPFHNCTLAELKVHFLDGMPRSATRPEIWAGWMAHRSGIESVGISYTSLIDGSFATTKLNPVDIDLCYLFDANELNGLAAPAKGELKNLFDVTRAKSAYRCDPYYIAWYPLTHMRFQTSLRLIAYWSRVFGNDRKGHFKCIPLVCERGVL